MILRQPRPCRSRKNKRTAGARVACPTTTVPSRDDMTKSEARAALIDLVRRNLKLVAVGIAEINRVRDFMILEFEFDSALL